MINKAQRTTPAPLQGPTGIAYFPEEKAELFATTLQLQFQPNLNIIPAPQIGTVEAQLTTILETQIDHLQDTPPTTEQEITQLIRTLPNKKTPGPDGITTDAIKHAPPEMYQYLSTSTFFSLIPTSLPPGKEHKSL